ncbi:four-carbon acid sugar kinase family protein [Streptomyces sp. DSM 41014]|uniref:3-oxo-tetronate kinase n=1 Tax=Streptomyces hintoniae TaxID=3075521 RepID=A0ABU2UP78_9ACTN|nr:3-oxo-tetronate kinase [Streptomyces sp. DSM 41014]MDT0475076.1 four-carbon acid sugar kinase family protein [Streptomyces sp. DSM 41014]
MPTLGAIADDFTGATDLATMLVGRGFRTVVAVGPDSLDGADPALTDADAVVVALKSRTAPVDEAVALSRRSLDALRALGCRRFYLKYCSTFDSTPRGNIGPVTDALLDALDARRTVVVPSFPATGRTVYRGRLFVHDELLDESPMRRHPLTPMLDSRVHRLLEPQTRRPVARVGLETVRSGPEALRAALDAPERADALTVVDAVDDRDLAVIAAATEDFPLVTGAAGLAVGFEGAHRGAARSAPASRPGDPAVVLAGSASAATRAQVAHALDLLPHRRLDLAALRADFDGTLAELTAFARRSWAADPGRPPLIYAVATPEDVEKETPAGAEPASDLVERALARCASHLVDAGARRLLVAGGETSGAVVSALRARTLAIGAPIAPGVTWARAEVAPSGRPETIDLALKSGNFGATDIFTTAWEQLA